MFGSKPLLLLFFLLINFSFAIAPVCGQGDPVRAFHRKTAAIRPPGTKIRIDLIGDSTQTDHAGYGRGFCANLTAEVDCVNMAKGGASTRTFRELGLWERCLLTKPDYMLIQFGHNDMERVPYYPPQTTMAEYEANLRRFVREARAAGIRPILVTPITRQYFEKDGKIAPPLAAHAATMKRVAREMNVPLIDLHEKSVAYLDRLGPQRASALAISTKDADGKTVVDKTHWNWEGSYVFGRMVAVELARVEPELARYVRRAAATLPPQGVKEMRIFHGAPVKIVLAGDAAVKRDQGWGKAFCAALTPNVNCVDDSSGEEGVESYVNSGAWKKAQEDHGDYYLIEFAHNGSDLAGYSKDLRQMVRDVKSAGAVPVLVTPAGRQNTNMRLPKADLKLREAVASTLEIGAEEDVTVVDLFKMAQALEGKRMTLAQQQGELGRMVANALPLTRVELGPDIVGEPAKTEKPANRPG